MTAPHLSVVPDPRRRVDLPPQQAWDRRPTDTHKSWEAFVVYRDMGPDRSYAEVARQMKKDPRFVRRWANSYDWRKRAAAFDADQDKQIQDKLMARRWTNAQHRAQIGDALLTRAAQVLQRFDPTQATVGDAVQMIRLADQIQSNVYFPRTDTGVNVNAVAQIVIDSNTISPPTRVASPPDAVVDAL